MDELISSSPTVPSNSPKMRRSQREKTRVSVVPRYDTRVTSFVWSNPAIDLIPVDQVRSFFLYPAETNPRSSSAQARSMSFSTANGFCMKSLAPANFRSATLSASTIPEMQMI